jgi:hypothetical protein
MQPGRMRRVGEDVPTCFVVPTAGIERVEVHLERSTISQQTMVRWKKWTLSSVMGEPRGVVEIGRGGFAVFVLQHRPHSRPPRRCRNAPGRPTDRGDGAGRGRRAGRILRRLVHHVLDQRAGKPEASVIAEDRTRPGHDLDARLAAPATGPPPPAHRARRNGCARFRPRSGACTARRSGPDAPGACPAASGADGDRATARRPVFPTAAHFCRLTGSLRLDWSEASHIRTLSDFGS